MKDLLEYFMKHFELNHTPVMWWFFLLTVKWRNIFTYFMNEHLIIIDW